MPTEATVAHVLVSRYADHLPLYRQSQILARQGIEIGREVLADWVGAAAVEIVPVVRRMHEILLASRGAGGCANLQPGWQRSDVRSWWSDGRHQHNESHLVGCDQDAGTIVSSRRQLQRPRLQSDHDREDVPVGRRQSASDQSSHRIAARHTGFHSGFQQTVARSARPTIKQATESRGFTPRRLCDVLGCGRSNNKESTRRVRLRKSTLCETRKLAPNLEDGYNSHRFFR